MSNRFKLVADHACADGWAYDPWGTAMSMFFDIAAVLDASDIDGDITPKLFTKWAYRPSPHFTVPSLHTLAAQGDEVGASGEQSLAQAVLDGDITTDDLIYVGDVMHRYTALLRAAGRDY